jgi:hypothetical protein
MDTHIPHFTAPLGYLANDHRAGIILHMHKDLLPTHEQKGIKLLRTQWRNPTTKQAAYKYSKDHVPNILRK